MKRLFFLLLMLAAFLCANAQDAAIDPAARERLKVLNAAVRGYIVLHDGKAPEKLSVLFYEGLVRNLSEFLRPGSATMLTAGTDIDTKSDYTLEPIGGLKDIIVREKFAEPGKDKLLAAFADGSIKLVPAPAGSTAGGTPTASSPTPAAIASPTPVALASPTPAAKASPTVMASPAAESGMVVVPNLALFDGVPKMKAELQRLGLTGSFSAKGKPPSKAMEFKFASQSPAADTKVKPGTKVEVFIYQKFEETTAGVTGTTSTGASATPAPQGDEVVVPNLAQFDTVAKMKAALDGVGLKGQFSAKGKPPTKALEFKFASQTPPADARVKRGTTVAVSIYQKFEEGPGPVTTSSPTATAAPAPPAPPLGSTPAPTTSKYIDPYALLEGAKWVGSWRGKVIRTGEPIAGSQGPDEEEFTLLRRKDGADMWVIGSAPQATHQVEGGKFIFKTKNTTPPQYTELEKRGDRWVGRWVAGGKVLATFDLAPIPKPSWASHM